MFERKHNFDINNEIFKSRAKNCVKAYSSSASFDLNVLTTVTMQQPPPPSQPPTTTTATANPCRRIYLKYNRVHTCIHNY